MIWIWFGLDGTGIDESPGFHWLLGPVLMVLFAFLGNTLFLTVLVSMLSNTFSGIASNAVQEIQFRRAVLTFEGVKSDAIFAYMPPFNILALMVMLPLKLVVSERMFHKINVAAVRTINLPTLLVIAIYERRTLWVTDKRFKAKQIDWKNANGPKTTNAQYWAMSRFSVHGDVYAVFDIDPPKEILDGTAGEDDLDDGEGIGKTINKRFNDEFGVTSPSRRESQATTTDRRTSVSPRAAKKKRRDSWKGSENLQKEFADSSEAEEEADHPKGYRKPKRGERMDSIIDYNDDGTNDRLLEANARLHKMEEAMARMEAMLTQLVNGDASSENSQAQEELTEEVQNNSFN